MNVHKTAQLTPHGRAELVRRVLMDGQAAATVARCFGVDAKTVGKWVKRFEAEGRRGWWIAPHGLTGRIGRQGARRWNR